MTRKEKVFSTTGFLITLILIFSFVHSEIYKRTIQTDYSVVLNNDTHLNIMFFGSSHMENAISPMLLWKYFGLTSYNFGECGECIPTDFYSMVLATEQSKPDLVVLDVYKIAYELKESQDLFGPQEYCIPFCFNAPLSIEKIQLINTYNPKEYRLQNMFPISNYHYNWNQIANENFWTSKTDCRLGLHIQDEPNPGTVDTSPWNTSIRIPLDNLNSEYLRKFIEYCLDEKINLLLVVLPFYADQEYQAYLNSCQDLANLYGIPFYNMNDPLIMDYNTDFTESFCGHVNSLGSYKTTYILGNYLTSNYTFETNPDVIDTDFWNDTYSDYFNYQLDVLKSQTTLSSYLINLGCMDVSFEVDIYNTYILTNSDWLPFWNALGYENLHCFTASRLLVITYHDSPNEIYSDTDVHIAVYSNEDHDLIDEIFYDIGTGFISPTDD